MNVIALIIAAGLVLLALFVVANWTLITAPASLNFLAFTIEGPLGLILLAAAAFLLALCAVYVFSVRTSALIEGRKHTRALETQRAVAENAEASRLAALTERVDAHFAELKASIDGIRSATDARVAALETALTKTYTDHANALFANIGQIDEKLSRYEPGGEARP